MFKRILAAALCFCLAAAILPQGVRAADTAPEVSAKAYILIEASTGRMLAGRNQDAQLPIASTTKILTALITLEQPGLDEYFKVDSNAIKVEGSSMGLREGDMVTLAGLAAGMLLPSGNDAANAAAVRIGGTVEKFAERMNRKAADIGMDHSHFVTPSGLHNDEHYSTAADMALLARHALRNERFAAICRQPSLKLSFGNPPYDRWLTNHNRLVKEYPGCIGMKTGFTKAAGRCLVSAAERDGVTLICVTLSAPNDWSDHTRLLDYGFSQVTKTELEVDTSGLNLNVVGGMAETFPVKPLAPSYACVTEEQAASVTQTICASPFYYAPIRRGEVVGEVIHYYDGIEIARTPLVADRDVPADLRPREKGFWDKIKEFFETHFRL